MSWRAALRARRGLVIGALACSFLLTAANVAATFFSDREHFYGAPVPVGTSQADVLFGGSSTFSPILFALDVAVTATLLAVMTRFLFSGLAVGTLSALVSLGVALYTESNRADYAGFPIPVDVHGIHPTAVPASIVFWADMMLWALASSALARWLRRAFSSAPRSQADR